MNIVSNAVADGNAGMSVDITNPAHAAYAGAAVVGATVIVGSVAVTTIAAPGLVLVPGAVAAGLCAYAHYENDRRTADADTADAPASA
jgi:hypothetical protein